MIRKHWGQHADCFPCKISTIQFGASSMPGRRAQAVAMTATEAEWQRDIPAYKQLRADGYQPRSTQGADELAARATTREEIEGLPKLWKDRAEILTGEIPGGAT